MLNNVNMQWVSYVRKCFSRDELCILFSLNHEVIFCHYFMIILTRERLNGVFMMMLLQHSMLL